MTATPEHPKMTDAELEEFLAKASRRALGPYGATRLLRDLFDQEPRVPLVEVHTGRIRNTRRLYSQMETRALDWPSNRLFEALAERLANIPRVGWHSVDIEVFGESGLAVTWHTGS